MDQVTLFDIQSYFKRYGWSYQRDGHTYSYVSEAGRTYSIRASVNPTFVSFESLILTVPDYCSSRSTRIDIIQRLTDLNAENSLIKLIVDRQGSVLMLVDHLALGFKYQHFELVIGIMGYYTDVIHTVINEVVDSIRSKKNLCHSVYYSHKCSKSFT